MKLGSLSNYKILNSPGFFAYLLALLKSCIICQLWFVVVLKFSSFEFWSCEMRMVYSLVDISTRFTLSLGFLLNVCIKINIHFVYYFVLRCKFVVALLWGNKKFYWIIWGHHNGDPMGITFLKWAQPHVARYGKYTCIHVFSRIKIYLLRTN